MSARNNAMASVASIATLIYSGPSYNKTDTTQATMIADAKRFRWFGRRPRLNPRLGQLVAVGFIADQATPIQNDAAYGVAEDNFPFADCHRSLQWPVEGGKLDGRAL